MLRLLAAVIISYCLSVALVLATDPLLTRIFPADYIAGRIPSSAALATSTAFFILISILCAALCALIAQAAASRAVFWFFILGEVMGAVATIPNWSKGWPHWYFLAWLLSWPISCWIGLRLARRRRPAAAAAH
jgi:hypothetical protein